MTTTSLLLRPADGTVEELLKNPRYNAGTHGIYYLESGRGACTAFVDRFGRRRIRVAAVGTEERPVRAEALSTPGWLVAHDGEGGEPLPPVAARRAVIVIDPDPTPPHAEILLLPVEQLLTLVMQKSLFALAARAVALEDRIRLQARTPVRTPTLAHVRAAAAYWGSALNLDVVELEPKGKALRG